MKKAINLTAHLHIGNDPGAADGVRTTLIAAFTAANPGWQLTIKSLAPPDAQGNSTAHVYIKGEAEPAADFAQMTSAALHQAVAGLNPPAAPTSKAAVVAGSGPKVTIHQVSEDTDNADDENVGVVLPPGHTIAGEQAAIAARATEAASAAAPSGDHADMAPTTTDRPAPSRSANAATLAAGTPAPIVPAPPAGSAAPTTAPPPAPNLKEPPAKPATAVADHAANDTAATAHSTADTAAADHAATPPSLAPRPNTPTMTTTHPAVAAPALPAPASATGVRRRNKGRKGGGTHRHSG